ncbi:hypothetical protein FRC07_008308 [Ceratobasidium sp. 392]|nr:hypothetical protein FRC07_008308 [Ceratobasidium sp. 392]
MAAPAATPSFADRIARLCIDEYTRHPEFHPTARSNGVPQFTVLAAVVLVQEQEGKDLPIALATGSKCLPAYKLPKLGNALHDSHAEVLARRAAIRWMYQDILECVRTGVSSLWIERRGDESGRWKIRDGVRVWMYVSTLPCGDASTTALAINQPVEMAELKALSPMPTPEKGTTARGRDNYNALGWLRTKPARADAPPTISHACSDKIALWSLVGFQGALLFQLMGPIFLTGVVLGDVLDQFSESDMGRVIGDCQRALVSRLRPLPERIETPPELRILFARTPFPHARSQNPASNVVSDPESHIWMAPNGPNTPSTSETLVNGFRRGVGPKRQNNPKFQPLTCKMSMMRLHLDTRNALGLTLSQSMTYYQLKRTEEAEKYQVSKTVLRSEDAPLQGWLVSGREWEAFEIDKID